MDNLTHTLIGALIGETAARAVPSTHSTLPEARRRNLFVGLMAIGSNVPDLDFIYPFITGNKLDYLLQHRGHTHTVIGAVLIAFLLFAASELWIRIKGLQVARPDRLALFGMALLGPLLHLAMDFTNSYGVHPFWPFDNRWFYGDFVFILEPLLWAAAAPLLFLLGSRVARVLVGLVMIAGISLSFITGLVPIPFAIALTLLIAALLAIARWTSPLRAALAGIGVWIATTLMYFGTGVVAERQAKSLVTQSPRGRLLDQVLTPLPVNPVCWDVILIQTDEVHYSLTRATLSLAPTWLPASSCPARPLTNTTAPLADPAIASTAAVLWRGTMRLSLSQLRSLARDYCQVADLLRFARAPFFVQSDQSWIAGDLRFDREPQADFAEVELSTERCPSLVPPWIVPRADLLEADPSR